MDFNSNSVSPNQFPISMSTTPFVMQQHEQNREVQKERLQLFWQKQMFNIQVDEELKSHLPVSRIRRIMKSDAKMVSGESPLLMGKACEFFIQELTYRAWMNAQEANRRAVKPCDVAKAIMDTDLFDFLTDVIVNYCAFDDDKGDNAKNFVEVNQLTVGNVVEEGNQLNTGNSVIGNKVALPYAAGLMENPMMYMGNDQVATNQQNVGLYFEGKQAALPHATDFMGNPMMNMGNDQTTTYQPNVGNFVQGNQGFLPHAARFMGNPMMNMGNDQVFPQPYMMQPPFMSSHQMPYNYHP